MMASRKKELEKQLELQAKKDEYNRMQKNINLKQTLEQLEKNQ